MHEIIFSEIKTLNDIYRWLKNVKGEDKWDLPLQIRLRMDINALYAVRKRCPYNLTLQADKNGDFVILTIKEGENAKNYITAFNYAKILNEKIYEHPFFCYNMITFLEEYNYIQDKKSKKECTREFYESIPELQKLCSQDIDMLQYTSAGDFDVVESVMVSEETE